MTTPREAVEAVQKALGCRESEPRASWKSEDRPCEPWCVKHYYEPWTDRGCPVAVAAADAAAPAIAAQALREAAEEMQRGADDQRRGLLGRAAFKALADWVRARADRIESD